MMLRRFPWAVPDRDRDNSFKAFIDAEGENPTLTHEIASAKAAGLPPPTMASKKLKTKRKRKGTVQGPCKEVDEAKDSQETPNGKESLLTVPRTSSPSGGTSSFGCDLVVVTPSRRNSSGTDALSPR